MVKEEKKKIKKIYTKSLKSNFKLIKSINRFVYEFQKNKLKSIIS